MNGKKLFQCPCITAGGGYPIPGLDGGGIPHFRSGQGVQHPRVRMGVPIPGLLGWWGVPPQPGLDGVPPAQDWMR